MSLQIKVMETFFIIAGCCFLPSCMQQQKDKSCGLTNPFFAMDTATDAKNKTASQQVQLLKEIGYAGIGYWERDRQRGISGLSEILEELDKQGLKAYPVYFGVHLDADREKYSPILPEAIKLLKGRDTAIWLYVSSSTYKVSSPEGDPCAVEIIREIADMAEQSGVKIALYPHHKSWLERVEDAVRVAKKVDRKNVGVTFNLCHWLRTDDEENMRAVLELAMPYLFVVTINGADSGSSNWNGLIQPLDSGTFDTYKFLKTLKELGYTGPIGLQGFGVKGDAYQNLKRSMDAWRRLSHRLAQECPEADH